MGEEAHGQVHALKDLAEQLQQKGYIRKSKERLELTARGIRQIAQKAMLDIFASLRRDQFGKHGLGVVPVASVWKRPKPMSSGNRSTSTWRAP